MVDRSEITPTLCALLLRYEPETGRLFWRQRSPELFPEGIVPKEIKCRRWNSRYAGKEAFTSTGNGYRQGSIWNFRFDAHRVAWAIVHGDWPNPMIDHINGNRSDNRIVNLRVVTVIENTRNMARSCRNTSGLTGVAQIKSGRWRAYLSTRMLGEFSSFKEAAAVRRQAELGGGYHQNHGRAAFEVEQ